MMRYKPMLPTLTSELPAGSDWCFEIKYDGFRCLLYIDESEIDLYSRNLRSLKAEFPEIVHEAEQIQQHSEDLPILLDGELCILDTPLKASFSKIQKRGRMKKEAKIQEQVTATPATYLVFDLLMRSGNLLKNEPFHKRKRFLEEWVDGREYPTVNKEHHSPIQWIPFSDDGDALFAQVKESKGEGVVAKRRNSVWVPGKRTNDWLKVKRLYRGFFIVIGLDEGNGYFHVAVVNDEQLQPIGLFSHGLEGQEREALIQIVKKNQVRKRNNQIEVTPRICVELEFLEIYQMQLRHPRFIQFRLDIHWEDCTWEALQMQMEN
ncbi:non-homologous end-joining DNA ligase [Pseudalkalibacillus sp. Hm43]|uniref:non-homologous end-joining DNA ligase n=1 Tax=Pseudalkalibacillus sp. Hm43 TaxID=3450742 RepID=UPI003F424599